MTTRAQDDAGIVAAIVGIEEDSEGTGRCGPERDTAKWKAEARAALFAAIDAWAERKAQAVNREAETLRFFFGGQK